MNPSAVIWLEFWKLHVLVRPSGAIGSKIWEPESGSKTGFPLVSALGAKRPSMPTDPS